MLQRAEGCAVLLPNVAIDRIRERVPASCSVFSSALFSPFQTLLFPPLTLPTPTARVKSYPQALPKEHGTTTRCPFKWLVCDRCAYVSTRRRLCGIVAGCFYRPYQGKSPHRLALSVALLSSTPPIPTTTVPTPNLAISHRNG